MAADRYDAIVIGARCAGSPTAMLLARKGYRVLVVDRATFPSDTMSTHVVHPPGVAALERWGLLDRLKATGCPPITRTPSTSGRSRSPGSRHRGSPVAYCPRRTVLDQLLVDAASRAGAEVRDGFTVDEVLDRRRAVTGIRGHGKGGDTSPSAGDVVIGADGRNSLVAKAVAPEQYHERPQILCGYYAYWSGLPVDGTFAVYVRPDADGRSRRPTTT